jgi:hypothetical protein
MGDVHMRATRTISLPDFWMDFIGEVSAGSYSFTNVLQIVIKILCCESIKETAGCSPVDATEQGSGLKHFALSQTTISPWKVF